MRPQKPSVIVVLELSKPPTKVKKINQLPYKLGTGAIQDYGDLHFSQHSPQAQANLLQSSTVATILKGAADTLRIDILSTLQKNSFGVQELAYILNTPQPGMSHHLKILAKSGLVTSRREGNSLFYRRSVAEDHDPTAVILKMLFRSINSIELGKQYDQRIKKVHAARATASRNYFNKNASRFAEKQGQIVTYKQYATLVEKVILGLKQSTSAGTSKTAMEIGPGEGELLLFLANNFDHVIALDNSEEMLDKSKELLIANNISKGEFLLGEAENAIPSDITVDLLVLNMVLHHMPAPASIFTLAHKLLSQHGFLFLIELCSHDQNWVKESCGDIWLGFEAEELSRWAQESGFSEQKEIFLGLKNGFQLQFKVFWRHTAN